ncbi:hypothetical protein [Pectobacterium carotovorum]|uniref:hypothetical protein n=1 Tax=Pectobacterium carotovorum TaxID=554 RepID=UPI00301A4884
MATQHAFRLPLPDEKPSFLLTDEPAAVPAAASTNYSPAYWLKPGFHGVQHCALFFNCRNRQQGVTFNA